jgi:hypothetical protein
MEELRIVIDPRPGAHAWFPNKYQLQADDVGELDNLDDEDVEDAELDDPELDKAGEVDGIHGDADEDLDEEDDEDDEDEDDDVEPAGRGR